MKQLREACVEALQQITSIVADIAPGHYNRVTPHSSSCMGSHVRHVVDHFVALRAGLLSRTINYNVRHRDSKIESDPQLASDRLRELCHWLEEVEIEDGAIHIETEISLTTTSNKILDSTVSRELCYLINHTIHHAAYIGVIARQLGMKVDTAIGVAPATGTYLRTAGNR